ncbi:hypothetical protein [Metabacillus sp. B2-18]|uniref:hypothetical protein n=1 Tax=Metabacillus sp. B2-18 TaxID=2897333 RepID=UPI001E3235FA|nr:hypothetical protein [Metabacillus sp. B2-18]UGB29954.1 hypothetical protein LPC09_19880 [Metabacillus sp. B2-18]
MSEKIINREAGDKGKGARLQKLRAVNYLLDNMIDKENIAVCVANELFDDVYLKTLKADGSTQTVIEGDKNYNPDSKFSFHSNEVTNSLIILLDCWIINRMSESVIFCFYTNAKYGKENHINGLKNVLPKEPILRLLKNYNYSDEKLLPYIKLHILKCYEDQYKRHGHQGNLHIIKAWTDKIWIDFLNRIDWQFERENHTELEEMLLEKISKYNPYSGDISGKEKFILHELMDELERRQDLKDYYHRLISEQHVKTVYLEIMNNVRKRKDPIHKMWETIKIPVDTRNISEKIYTVCKNFDEDDIGDLERGVCEANIELGELDDRDSGSYKYRIYTICKQKIKHFIRQNEGKEMKQMEIEDWIEILVSESHDYLLEVSKDFQYEITNRVTLKNTILYLFDMCFLAFDKEVAKGE